MSLHNAYLIHGTSVAAAHNQLRAQIHYGRQMRRLSADAQATAACREVCAMSLFRGKVPGVTAEVPSYMDVLDRNKFPQRCRSHRSYPHTSQPPGPPHAPPHQDRVIQESLPCQACAGSPLKDRGSAPESSHRAPLSVHLRSESPDQKQVQSPVRCAAAFHLKNSTDTASPVPLGGRFRPAPSAPAPAFAPLPFSFSADAPGLLPQSAHRSSSSDLKKSSDPEIPLQTAAPAAFAFLFLYTQKYPYH